jgi:enhancing lycopene biosynthesis protein 2
MSPTTIAKAVEGTDYHPKLTVGSTAEASPYEIDAISQGINVTGAVAEMKTVKEVLVDRDLKIITAPCYMMDASITEVYENIRMAVEELNKV